MRERDEASGGNAIDLAPATPETLCEEVNSSSEPIMSAAGPIVPDAVRQIYQQLLPNNPRGIEFIFSPAFAKALRVPAERASLSYGVTTQQASEELRRLLTIKAFVADEEATKIGPTPLSKMDLPQPSRSLEANCGTSG